MNPVEALHLYLLEMTPAHSDPERVNILNEVINQLQRKSIRARTAPSQTHEHQYQQLCGEYTVIQIGRAHV